MNFKLTEFLDGDSSTREKSELIVTRAQEKLDSD